MIVVTIIIILLEIIVITLVVKKLTNFNSIKTHNLLPISFVTSRVATKSDTSFIEFCILIIHQILAIFMG